MLRVRMLTPYGLLLVLLAWLGSGVAAQAAERVALVIGNSRYDHAAYLNNPERDAQAIAEMLSDLGFQVTGPLLNQDKSEMDNALKQFGRQARSAEAAVVYFSGHGVEVNGRNYLLPKDAVLEQESDASLETVALDVVLDQIGGASHYRLVILDACRDNPLANHMARAKGEKAAYRGLAPVEPGGQTYVAYAARAGQRSQDGAAGGNSPYATALLKYLPQPGLPLERLFGSVREEVLKATTRTQEPVLYGSFGAEPIYLAGLAPEPVPAPVPAPPSPAVDHDLIAWQSAEKCGTAACFRAYLKTHPQGRYVEMARARLEPPPPSVQPEPRWISNELVNVRSGPGPEHPAITQLARGSEITWLGASTENPDWQRIRLSDGRVAYVHGNLLSRQRITIAVAGSTASYGQKAPEPAPPRRTENPLVSKIKKIKTINDQNVLASSRLMGESCEFLASNFDASLLDAIIEFYGVFMKYDTTTHHIFIELLPIEEKFPQQLQQSVEKILTKEQQAIFWERFQVAKREALEGNG